MTSHWLDSQIFATLVGVVVGWTLSELTQWLARLRRMRNHWAALRTEVEYCGRAACAYVSQNVKSPLYRLPTSAYATAFPALLQDGVAKEVEIQGIVEFFTLVQTFNRGLDQADAAREDPEKLQIEYGRNLLKTNKIGSCSDIYKNIHALLASRA